MTERISCVVPPQCAGKMCEPEDVDQSTWCRWILDAIRKIRSQKQRPSVERICHAIRQHHNYHEDVVSEHLEIAVKDGSVLKVFNKGQSSYKDPGGLQNRTLKITLGVDLSKVVAKAVRELGERDGSTIKSIEKYLRQSHTLELDPPDCDIRQVLRLSAKRAVTKGLVTQDGKAFKIAYNTGAPVSSSPTVKKRQSTSESNPSTPSPKKQPDESLSPKVCLYFYLFFMLYILICYIIHAGNFKEYYSR